MFVSDQRYEGALGLLVWRCEEHGHAGGAAGTWHPDLNQSSPRTHTHGPQTEASMSPQHFLFVLFSCFLLDVFCYRHCWWPSCKLHCGILQINGWLWHYDPQHMGKNIQIKKNLTSLTLFQICPTVLVTNDVTNSSLCNQINQSNFIYIAPVKQFKCLKIWVVLEPHAQPLE